MFLLLGVLNRPIEPIEPIDGVHARGVLSLERREANQGGDAVAWRLYNGQDVVYHAAGSPPSGPGRLGMQNERGKDDAMQRERLCVIGLIPSILRQGGVD